MERRLDLDRRAHVDAWRRSVPFGANLAAFAPDQEIRCPRTVKTGAGDSAICGGYLGDAEAHVVVYSVRRTDRYPASPASLIRQKCPRCAGYYRVCAPAEPMQGAA